MVSLPHVLLVFTKPSTSEVLSLLLNVAEMANELPDCDGTNRQMQYNFTSLISRRSPPRSIKGTNILHGTNLQSDVGLCSGEFGSKKGMCLDISTPSFPLLPCCRPSWSSQGFLTQGQSGPPFSGTPGHLCLSSAEGFSICWNFSISVFCTCQRLLFRLMLWDQILAVAVTPVVLSNDLSTSTCKDLQGGGQATVT